MAYIKYVSSKKYLNAKVMPVKRNVVRITTGESPNMSGFRLYLEENKNYPLDSGEYEKYTTLYRQGDGWYELSNDGSVYVEPEPEAESVVALTEEQLEMQERMKKMMELKGQIDFAKSQLTAKDYQIIKTYEYSLVEKESTYDIEALHQEREALRSQVNELEAQLFEIQGV